jgi:hypothetical protein
MIDLWPRRFIPRWVPMSLRRDFTMASTALALLGIGIAFGAFFPVNPTAGGIWAEFAKLREISHPFACPFCGGTRAFISCCRFDYLRAASQSLPGCFAFLWLLLFLPLHVARLVDGCKSGNGTSQRFLFVVKVVEAPRVQIACLLGLWIIQLTLHWLGVLHWEVISWPAKHLPLL